ncbi:hypothetical protein [Janthinobacterium lividum]|uniref:hypothetical protein n=1 Tax=Janthinobacterium lividum TaxID=29581 RepID=UPI001B833A25|nr:hypothetical protein [Janthinobacterium lividum]MBR7635125.1 hypothetical protein [Janthinobacterium lividum]
MYNSFGLFFLFIFSSSENFLSDRTGDFHSSDQGDYDGVSRVIVTSGLSLERYSSESEAVLLAITLPSSANIAKGRARPPALPYLPFVEA